MSRQSDFYIYQQLEPSDTLRAFTGRKWLMQPGWKPVVDLQTPREPYSEDQDNRDQDAYLESKGVPVGPRN